MGVKSIVEQSDWAHESMKANRDSSALPYAKSDGILETWTHDGLCDLDAVALLRRHSGGAVIANSEFDSKGTNPYSPRRGRLEIQNRTFLLSQTIGWS